MTNVSLCYRPVLAIQLYQIVYLHQLSPVCHCPLSSSAGVGGPNNLVASSVSRQTAPPAAKVRPASQTAPSTSELLADLQSLTGDPASSPEIIPSKPPSQQVPPAAQPQQSISRSVSPPPVVVQKQAPYGGGQLQQQSSGGTLQLPLLLPQLMLQTHPQGIGILLGVGQFPLPLQLLQQWHTSPGFYLVDPFIHLFGYDDPSNVSDKEHQLRFERLNDSLKPYENRFSLVRDFASSFFVTFTGSPGTPPVSLLYVDNKIENLETDMDQWEPTLAPNAFFAGPGWGKLKKRLEAYCNRKGLTLGMLGDGDTWFATRATAAMLQR